MDDPPSVVMSSSTGSFATFSFRSGTVVDCVVEDERVKSDGTVDADRPVDFTFIASTGIVNEVLAGKVQAVRMVDASLTTSTEEAVYFAMQSNNFCLPKPIAFL